MSCIAGALRSIGTNRLQAYQFLVGNDALISSDRISSLKHAMAHARARPCIYPIGMTKGARRLKRLGRSNSGVNLRGNQQLEGAGLKGARGDSEDGSKGGPLSKVREGCDIWRSDSISFTTSAVTTPLGTPGNESESTETTKITREDRHRG